MPDFLQTPRGFAQLTCTILDGGRTLGYLTIDTVVAGRASGGVRMQPDITAQEVEILARRMTYKFAFFRLPQGGAKAGIIGDPQSNARERQALITRFAEAIAPLVRARIFSPAIDMGTSTEDIRLLWHSAGITSPPTGPLANSSAYTALTVFLAAQAAAHHIGSSLCGWRVAIEGFGKVGSQLAQHLISAGARVVAISTAQGAVYRDDGFPLPQLLDALTRYGPNLVKHIPGGPLPREKLFHSPVDLLCPCARPMSIHKGNASSINAQVICGAANAPISSEADAILTTSGILCIPDFVANAGGILGGTMAFAGLRPAQIGELLSEQFESLVQDLLASAAQSGCSPTQLAERIAQQRFAKVKKEAESTSWRARILDWGLALHRRQLIPPPITARLSLPYFRRRLR